MLNIESFKKQKLVIVLNGVAHFGGATKPIFNYYKHNINRGHHVLLLDITSFRGTIKLILAALFAPRITVNGLAAMESWMVLLICIFRRGIIIYCHEAEHAFKSFERSMPLKFRFLKWALSRSTVACVSQWQCDYISSAFKTGKSVVVYNNIDLDLSLQLDKERYNILMLGYLMPRKGVELFSRVADLAAVTHPEIQFSWIGSGNPENQYLSPHVAWLGEVLRPEQLLQQSEMLFLSAVDDPFPLACLEALAFYRKCVVYRNTGTAEVIRDLPGCAVYDEYEPAAAFEAILRAKETPLDRERVKRLQEEIASIDSFAKRFDELLEQNHPGGRGTK